MALIKCSECGHDVSDRAAACASCGNPIQSGSNGFVGVSQPRPTEGDVKRGVQRAKGRYEFGSGIALVGIALAVVIGIASGSFWVALVIGLVALIGGIFIQYS